MENKFLRAFKEAFDLDDDFLVDMKDEFRDYENWDSLTKLSLIAAIDEYFEITIENKQFEKLMSIQDLYDFIIKSK